MEAFSQNDSLPKSQSPSAKAIPTLLGSTPRHSSNQSSFREGQIAWWDHPPTSSNRPLSEQVKAFSQDKNPVSVSISQVIVYKVPFTNSSYAFRPWEWFNLSRDDVLLLRNTPLFVSFLVGWLATKCSQIFSSGEPQKFEWQTDSPKRCSFAPNWWPNTILSDSCSATYLQFSLSQSAFLACETFSYTWTRFVPPETPACCRHSDAYRRPLSILRGAWCVLTYIKATQQFLCTQGD
jgi:hypothetical protein